MPKPPLVPVPGAAARRAAWRILEEQENRGVFLKDLFEERLRGFSPEDKGLIRAICLGVTRQRRILDYNLDLQAKRGIPDARLRMLLRTGAFQILFLTRVPAFAAVNTTVEIAKREFGAKDAGFANALLKGLAKHGLRRPVGTDLKSMAIGASHPDWLVERWGKALAPDSLASALARNNEEAPLWIRVNPRVFPPTPKGGEGENAREILAAAGVKLEPGPVPRFYRILEGADQALRHPVFAAGGFSFQDPVAHWIAALLDWRPGQKILDACSAPGGKAALLLEMAAARNEDFGKSRIVCGDASFFRLRRMRDARVRLGHQELSPVCSDLGSPPFRDEGFDRVLLDAPCSNLGVLRRRPEARWNLDPEKISALAVNQTALLEKASALLAPGGRLVYAVCSAEAEETAEVIGDFLGKHSGFALDDAGKFVPGVLCRRGFLWVYPGETEYDGFFAAALVRPPR